MQGFVEFGQQLRADYFSLDGAGTVGVLDQVVASGFLRPCNDIGFDANRFEPGFDVRSLLLPGIYENDNVTSPNSPF
jgi:hypothetical protein